MNQDSRRWFDCAYKLTHGVLPFGLITEPPENNEYLIKITLGLFKKEEIFKLKIPSEQDFKEEKESILRDLVPDLKKQFPFVETAIHFGRIKGDIDIGLITSLNVPDETFHRLVYENKGLMKKYPIVDWAAVYFFKSRDGVALASKIVNSRLLMRKVSGFYNLDDGERNYTYWVINNSKLLWGKDKELSVMKSYLENMVIDAISLE